MKLVARVKLADVKEKGILRVPLPPFDICVVWENDELFAIEDACNHAGASLAEGWTEPEGARTCIVCPMHGYVFDLRGGKLLRPRGLCGDQRTFRVVVEGDDAVIYDPFVLAIA